MKLKKNIFKKNINANKESIISLLTYKNNDLMTSHLKMLKIKKFLIYYQKWNHFLKSFLVSINGILNFIINSKLVLDKYQY